MLQFMESQRVKQDLASEQQPKTRAIWPRKSSTWKIKPQIIEVFLCHFVSFRPHFQIFNYKMISLPSPIYNSCHHVIQKSLQIK